MKTLRPQNLAVAAVCLVLALLAPAIFGTDPVHLGQLQLIVAAAMVCVGLNLVLGYAGVVFLGPGALMAAGGYAAAYFAQEHTSMQSLPAMCAIAVLVALVLGAIAALPTLRISGFYFGMVALLMAQALPLVASRNEKLGKSSGLSLQTVFTFVQKPSGTALYYTGVFMVVALTAYAFVVVYSRLGRRLVTIRSGDELAQVVGITPYSTKLVAFLLAAVPSGIAGAYYVYSQQFISPESVTPNFSIFLVAGIVIGGGGSLVGPIIGTAVVFGINQFLTKIGPFQLQAYQGAIFGLLLISFAMFLPYGLVGLGMGLRMKLQERFRKGPQPPVAEAAPAPAVPARPVAPVVADGAGADGAFIAKAHGARLRVEGIARSFGGVKAVIDVSLDVQPGTVHGLVGPNGSGKTTVLNLVNGFYKIDDGAIWLDDVRIDGKSVAEITRLGVGRTFQTPKLSVYETVLENVVVAADRAAAGSVVGSVLRVPRSRQGDRAAFALAQETLDRLNLGHLSSAYAAMLSHGNQRLLEIARAMAMRPSLVLLDEPAAGLSVAEAAVLKDVIRSMRDEGITVLLVEHNLPVVFDLADTVTVLDQGLVIATGTPAEVSADPEVARVYLGRSSKASETEKVLAQEVAHD